MEDLSIASSEEQFEFLPCQKKFRLKPEDEISLDSIFSALLAPIESSRTHLAHYSKWELDPKEILNEKQAILFEEHLYISSLKSSNCKLTEDVKIFLDRELEEIGDFCLNIEESYDGYVVYSNSKMRKPKSPMCAGHYLKGKYDNKFMLIVEKRSEYDYVDKARIVSFLFISIGMYFKNIFLRKKIWKLATRMIKKSQP